MARAWGENGVDDVAGEGASHVEDIPFVIVEEQNVGLLGYDAVGDQAIDEKLDGGPLCGVDDVATEGLGLVSEVVGDFLALPIGISLGSKNVSHEHIPEGGPRVAASVEAIEVSRNLVADTI